MARIGFPGAEKYTTYAFRRGCLVEIKRPQSIVAQIMKTAGMSSAQFKVYLDLTGGEEAVIGPLMGQLNLNAESEEELREF